MKCVCVCVCMRVCVRACVCVCACVCVGWTKKEGWNGGQDLLEGDVTECSVKGQEKWPNMTWGSHALKTSTMAGHDFKSRANKNSEIRILILLNHVYGIKKLRTRVCQRKSMEWTCGKLTTAMVPTLFAPCALLDTHKRYCSEKALV